MAPQRGCNPFEGLVTIPEQSGALAPYMAFPAPLEVRPIPVVSGLAPLSNLHLQCERNASVAQLGRAPVL